MRPDFPHLYSVRCHISYSRQKTPISKNNSFMTPFYTLFVLSRISDNTTSQNIGGTDAWAVPHLKFGGPSPSPHRSPPMPWRHFWMALRNFGDLHYFTFTLIHLPLSSPLSLILISSFILYIHFPIIFHIHLLPANHVFYYLLLLLLLLLFLLPFPYFSNV